MTIPNNLTLARLLLTPAIAILAYSPRAAHQLAALIVFLAAMLTDVLDGYIARKFNQRSLLGLYLDTVTDKIIVLAMFFVLADLGRLPFWVALLMMAREIVVDGVRAAGAVQGKVVGANWMGKSKTFLQTICIALGLALPLTTMAPGTIRIWVGGFAIFTLSLAWAFAAVFLALNRSLFVERRG
ncbi:MAG: CDP-diacylglycerol--glycerol-3-phosphate 3-phosphatidyltransferase [Verrucomicrobia bacterium]|nr:CDP-diacylglycerol--glycerol-3-phosphate 3-phosphatidyltransferase [Verrucomicrobiota bacterium]MDA1085903.1 CDP-diacylglycerol--glycerol-3-phosphate 3-phosphatidyltransferase [Verrucomicrobiota bacterium]